MKGFIIFLKEFIFSSSIDRKIYEKREKKLLDIFKKHINKIYYQYKRGEDHVTVLIENLIITVFNAGVRKFLHINLEVHPFKSKSPIKGEPSPIKGEPHTINREDCT